MKKTIIYILSVIMILTTFSGCNGTSEDPKKESESKEEAAGGRFRLWKGRHKNERKAE